MALHQPAGWDHLTSANLAGREVENARVAFESAVRWGRSGHSLVNLGVFEMRQRRSNNVVPVQFG